MAKKEDVRQVDVLPFEVSDKPKKSYIPDGFDSQEDFLEDMREEYKLDVDFDRQNRDEAVDDKQFAAGEQWDPEVLKYRKGLPCLTINTVPQFIAQLVGDWRQERNSVKVVPAEDGDVEVASVRGDLIRAIETKSRAERAYNNAFESAVTCGDGAFRVSVEYSKDDVFDQEIYIRPIDDALSVVWDRMSIDPTGRDARHCFVDDTIPIKEFKRKFGNEDFSQLGETMKSDLRSGGWITDEEAKITEYWRMIERDRLLGLFEDGSIHVLEGTPEETDALMDKHGMPIRTRLSPCLYAQMHLCTGFKILGGPYEYRLTRLPIIRMIGRTQNVAGRRIRYGLVRFMKDAVRLRNFWRSVAAEQLGYAPKAQWIAPESAVEGREDDFRKAHLSRDPLLIYNDGAEVPPQRLDPPAPQMALLNEAQVNAQDMKDITGIHDASLGIRSNETSGKAIMARQREGDVASLTFYDNGNASVLEGGDVTNQLISQVYDATRIIRIIGEDEAVKFMKVNDPHDPNSPDLSVGSYDTAMTTGPSYTTRRVEAAEAMMGAVQVYPEIMQIASDLIVKAQNWPGAEELAERLRKTIPPQLLSAEEQAEAGIDPNQGQEGIPPELMEQMAKMQEELQKLQQQTAEQALLLKNKEVENEIAWYKAETDRIKALTDHEVDANEIEMEAVSRLLDHSQRDADREHEAEEADKSREHEAVNKAVDQAHASTEARYNREHTAAENEASRKLTEKTAAKKAPAKK